MRQLFVLFIVFSGLIFSATVRADYDPSLIPKKKSMGSIQKFQNKKALEESQGAIGNKLSNFRFTDASGKGLTLYDLKGKHAR